MKTLKSNVLLFAILSMVISISSCSLLEEDACEMISCENGGTCNDGTCDCPDGFSGPMCETEDLCITSPINCENGGMANSDCTACECANGYTGDNCESFDASQVQALLANHTPIDLVNGGVPIDSLYGKMYEGGIIFYLNTDNGTGQVAALADALETLDWDGAIDYCNTLDSEGKNDWFLPSREELNLMYTNLHMNNLGGFAGGWYWSSTEDVDGDVWSQNFTVGNQFNGDKDFMGLVRAARAF